MAIFVAWHGRARIVGTEGAIEVIGGQPYGRVLLALVTLGLAGYAVWRVWAAISDADRDGTEWKGLIARAAIFCSGIGYGALALFAARRALRPTAPAGYQEHHWTATLLQHSWGEWLIGLVGVVLLVSACVEAYYAISEGYRERLRAHEMDSQDRAWLLRFGKWGYLAQAIVLGVAGWFLLRATLTSSGAPPAEGLDGALRIVARQEYGMWLLGIVSAGLAAYGEFMLVQARYRRLR
jgi:Domain of Unknown Function (DUF1206)